jgi:polyisoprenoid-binding protein YceI
MKKQIKWILDPNHSEVLFKVKHLMITNVKGEFRKIEGFLQSSSTDFSNASVEVTLNAASVFTNNEDRDAHLKGADFLDVEQHEQLTFKGTDFIKLDSENYLLKGMLTIKGISKPIQLDVEFGGTNKDPWGNEKAGFSVQGKLNRKDWGLNWNAALETGGVLVSDEVKINAEVQFTRDPEL